MLRLVLLFTCTLLGSLQAENVQLQVAANVSNGIAFVWWYTVNYSKKQVSSKNRTQVLVHKFTA